MKADHFFASKKHVIQNCTFSYISVTSLSVYSTIMHLAKFLEIKVGVKSEIS